MDMFAGIIPTLICLVLAVNALIKIIGEERIDRFARKQRKILFCNKQ
ncbi:hypothetical protein M3221_18065 [Domibacillus indicus]|nr:PTS glucitol/sorbitol transporter subunit IIC [Domibacillus indicus]MCM3790288.1 hypothetical protein [Domibacillus indicus]